MSQDQTETPRNPGPHSARARRPHRGGAALFSGGLLLLLAALWLPVCLAQQQSPVLSGGAMGGGAVRALVIGIDNYKNSHIVTPLGGAVADARDIEQALRRAGASDITLLIDDQGSRRRLNQALGDLVSRTRPDDLVVVTFAGHGSQQRERRRGTERDGKDEFFVLWGFGNTRANTTERFLDDEMFDWLGKLASTGARTIFLADVCHGGGLSKAPNIMAGRTRTRYLHMAETAAEAGPGAYYIAPGEDELVLSPAIPPEDNATRDHPSLTFIAGTDEGSTVDEVVIPGQTSARGAASYAFARALEGGADLAGNRDGMTSRAELMTFLNREIGRITRNRQSFVFEPKDLPSASFTLFAQRESRSMTIGSLARGVADSTGGNAPQAGRGTQSPTSPFQFVHADEKTGNVISKGGAILAYGLAPDELGPTLERFEVQERFAERQRERGIRLSTRPASPSYVEGQSFTISASGIHGLHLIVLNLTSSGRMAYLFPRGDVSSWQTQDASDIPIVVAPPFGADSTILIATADKRRQLEAELEALDGKTAPLKVWDTVMRHLKPEDAVGVVTYKTRAKTTHSSN